MRLKTDKTCLVDQTLTHASTWFNLDLRARVSPRRDVNKGQKCMTQEDGEKVTVTFTEILKNNEKGTTHCKGRNSFTVRKPSHTDRLTD
jgi:hypothetical protein